MVIIVGGLIEGVHYPKGKKNPIIDIKDCDNIFIISTDYFLENNSILKAWAKSVKRSK